MSLSKMYRISENYVIFTTFKTFLVNTISYLEVFKCFTTIFMCLGSIVVSVIDSHSRDRGSSSDQGNHIYVML